MRLTWTTSKPPGAQPEVERLYVDDHLIADLRAPYERDVGDRRAALSTAPPVCVGSSTISSCSLGPRAPRVIGPSAGRLVVRVHVSTTMAGRSFSMGAASYRAATGARAAA